MYDALVIDAYDVEGNVPSAFTSAGSSFSSAAWQRNLFRSIATSIRSHLPWDCSAFACSDRWHPEPSLDPQTRE